MNPFKMKKYFWLLICCFHLNGLTVAQERPKLSLQDLFASAKFRPNYFEGGRWATAGPVLNYIESSENGSKVMQYNLETDVRSVVLDGTSLVAPDTQKKIEIEDYTFSQDGTKVLLYTESAPVWRENTKGYYYWVDLQTKTVKPISDRKKGYQMFAKMNPSGTLIGFVRDRNLFLLDLRTGRETQLTRDGSEGKVINGTFDWVYEEEFGLRDGWSFSPDGQYIAYFKLDESAERNFTMMDLRGFYPEPYTFRYPKAGTPNAEVQVCTLSLAAKTPKCFDTETWFKGGDTYEYLARMSWTPKINGKHQVYMFRLNRDQNVLDLLYGDPQTGAVKKILTETEKTWVDVESEAWANSRTDKLTYLADGKHFVWRSEQDGWRHLYLYQNDGTKVRQLTKGEWEVSSFNGIDEKNGHLFITGTKDGTTERHLYRIPLAGGQPSRLTDEAGVHAADLSADFKYFIDTYSDINTPPIVKLKTMDGKTVKVLENNDKLIQFLAAYKLPKPHFMQIPGADGTMLNAFIIKPSTFDPNKKYPLLLHVYGGPGSQEVRNEWGGTERLWHMMLAEEKGVLVASVDNRGTGAKGKAFLGSIYKKLGQLEAADQIAAAKWFGEQSYVDAGRIGIWGWSYGGFMTLMSMTSEGGERFKAGLSVAPVGDWKQYDTIYTERYMSTPQKNEAGYKVSPVGLAKNLKDHQKLLIVHGDADDNVHLQNTIQVVDALQQHGKQFSLMVYPGKNHGIYGGATRLHLYTMLTNFVLDNL